MTEPTPDLAPHRCPFCNSGEARQFKVMASDVVDWVMYGCRTVIYTEGAIERSRQCQRLEAYAERLAQAAAE